MPTLTRFILACAVTFGLVYCAALALATLVEPTQRQIVVTIPQDRFERPASPAGGGSAAADPGAGLETASTGRLTTDLESFGFSR